MSMLLMAQVSSTGLDNPSGKLVLVRLKGYGLNSVVCRWSYQPSSGRKNRYNFMHLPLDCVASKGGV